MTLEAQNYRKVEKDGITAVIINKGKILLLKRRSLPFIVHPGYWSFVSGSRKKGERYLDTAYREIMEETGIDRSKLKTLVKNRDMTLIGHKKDIRWSNKFFIFRSSDRSVRLNLENSGYKWVHLANLKKENRVITDYIADSGVVLGLIKKSLIQHN